MKPRRSAWATAAAAALLLAAPAAGGVAAGSSQSPDYRANDYADGRALVVVPPGEHGLVNAIDLLKAEAPGGSPPAHSNDQTPLYEALLYGSPSVTDATLGRYYHDASFGVLPQDRVRVEVPDAGQPVTIYRDTLDVPHIYGDTKEAMAFGAGYAAAEDRLFEMDILRHLGAGHLAEFAGPSCAYETSDHDQLLFAGYTTVQKEAQVAALSGGGFGAIGLQAKTMSDGYLAGINHYIDLATSTNPELLPADFAAVVQVPTHWTSKDLLDVATVVAASEGTGGGGELHNAALLKYLQGHAGTAAGRAIFDDFKTASDPGAPTTIVDRAFPYGTPGIVDPSLSILPDSTQLTGGPTDTTAGCDTLSNLPLPIAVPAASAAPTSPKARTQAKVGRIATITRRRPPKASNVLMVGGGLSASGNPVAVIGPQVGYFAPEVLMEEDLHAPDFEARGVSFPGTNFIIELGRGRDFAWSATSSGVDQLDQRLLRVCNPGGGTPSDTGEAYVFMGACEPMHCHDDNETAIARPSAPGGGTPVQVNHHICQVFRGGVPIGNVVGWTKVGGQPYAVLNQRSTYLHDAESVLGFLRWNTPSLTHDAASFMEAAHYIPYTFNWFYVDDRDIAFVNSGFDPVRPANVDPTLPTPGDGRAEWQGMLPDQSHPQQVNPAHGYFINWNNGPAPRFAASDDDYTRQVVDRSNLLDRALRRELSRTGNKLTRADVVRAMETGGTQDLTGADLLPEVLPYLRASSDARVQAIAAQLDAWLADGAHRVKAQPGDSQYKHAAAIAIMDEAYPRLVKAIFGSIFSAAGATSTYDGLETGYPIVPQGWASTPNSDGGQLGDAYGGGWEGYVWKVLRQQQGRPVLQPFSSAATTRVCGSGLAGCPAAVLAAFIQPGAGAYDALVTANGGSTNVSQWTADTQTVTAKVTMPQYDSIASARSGSWGRRTSTGRTDRPRSRWSSSRATRHGPVPPRRPSPTPAAGGRRRCSSGWLQSRSWR